MKEKKMNGSGLPSLFLVDGFCKFIYCNPKVAF